MVATLNFFILLHCLGGVTFWLLFQLKSLKIVLIHLLRVRPQTLVDRDLLQLYVRPAATNLAHNCH